MRRFVAAALLVFSLFLNLDTAASAWEDKDFFSYCPSSRCSEHGPEIRFPFQLESNNTTPSSCGLPCMKLSCSGQDTILDIKNYLGTPYKVTAIDYNRSFLTVVPLVHDSSSSPCSLLKSMSIRPGEMDYSNCYIYDALDAALVSCSAEYAVPSPADDSGYITGSISCLSNQTHFSSYLVAVVAPMSLLPLDCEVISDGPIRIPIFFPSYDSTTLRESVERILNFSETMLGWNCYNCSQCESQGKHCAFSSQRNQTFCMRPAATVALNPCTLLPVGIHIAVKMLEGKSSCNWEDFITRSMWCVLWGYAPREWLVYEYMPCGSLDKYIFSSERNEHGDDPTRKQGKANVAVY
uniref:RING-type E3 ubiquitin transferase n=1 Tax=Oryza meridionalis TaxID=40149 RepID=A0A0E0BW52_9ORYZ